MVLSDVRQANGKGQSECPTSDVTGWNEAKVWDNICICVCSEIQIHLSLDIQMIVLEFMNVYILQEELKKRYMNKSMSVRLHAKTKLWLCMMKDGDDLAAHVQK